MSEKFYTLLTSIGKAKIANSSVLGSKVNFVKMKVGDGNGKYYNPTEEQTDLVNTVWEGNITHISVDENNPNWINIEVMIPANVGGFMIREYGVFDEEGNMLAIAKCAESYKPVAEDGSTKELLIKMVLAVSNTENITLKIDPTIIFAKKSELEVLENKIRDLKGVYAEDLLNETVIIEGEMHPLIKSEFEKVETKINENKENLESQMAEFAKKEELSKTTSGSSGAKSIGVSTISGLTGNDVQTCLQNLFQFADNGKKNF